MQHLIRLVSLRYLQVARGRSLLTVVGILLGVAVVFAVDVVNASVIGAIRQSMAKISGTTQLTIGADTGVDEEALDRVRGVRGVAAAIPVIEASVRDVRAHTQLVVLAVDTLSDPDARGYDVTGKDAHIDDAMSFLNDPHGVLVTTQYAKRTGASAGGKLLLDTVEGRKEFSIHGTLEPHGPATAYGGDMLVMDVYAAQLAFNRGRRFDRIDIIPQPDAEVGELAQRLEHALLGKVAVTRPQRRSQEAERLLAGFQLALSMASVVALFVGGFIVYNSLAIAVVQRRREIGILRALGATRPQVITLFVGEGLLMGLVGAGLGLGFGLLLARAALGAVAATVSALYLPVKVVAAVATARDMWAAAALGVASAGVAAFLPARRAAFVDPVSAMSGTIAAADVTFASTAAAMRAGLATLLLAGVVAWVAHVRQQSALAFVVAALLSFGAAFLAPVLAAAVGAAAYRRAKYLGPAALLGAVGFARNRGRNAVAIAALGMALANVVNVDALIDSMKSSTDAWLGRSFRADLVVFAGTEVHAKFDRPLPEALRPQLRALPKVEFVQAFRMVQQSFRDQPFYLMSEDFEGYRRYNELAVVDGELDRALPQLEAGTGIAASETFARNFHVGLGDVVTLRTPSGPRPFRIVLVYTDYRADIGILFTTRAAYTRIWGDHLVDLYSVYLTKGEPAEPVRAQIAHGWGERYGLLVLGSSDYRRELVGLVDRSMTLSRATEFVAVVVAILGIINALMVGVIDRRREIGVLKAIGAAREQLDRMVLTESVLIACTAALLGVLLGTGLSAYMVIEALRLQVGWRIAFHLSGWVVAETFVVALLVAWVAAFWPMRWAARLEIVDSLHHE
ncbi:MAG TPA: FtsX-like permease family protein [Polyangiales bacterium]